MERRSSLWALWLGAAVSLIPLVAPRHSVAGPPILSDDPKSAGDRKWEVNVNTRASWERRSLAVEGSNLDVNYGLGEHWQLKVEIPFAYEHEDGYTRSGIGSAVFGAKWRLLDQDEHGLFMSVHPQPEVPTLESLSRISDRERGPTATLVLLVALRRLVARSGRNGAAR